MTPFEGKPCPPGQERRASSHREFYRLSPKVQPEINDVVSAHGGADYWTNFLGAFEIRKHAASDRRMFLVITSQLIDSGSCREAEIVRSFGVPKSSVARALRRYRAGGWKRSLSRAGLVVEERF